MSSASEKPKDKKGLKAWLLRKRWKRDMLLFQHKEGLERETKRQAEHKAAMVPKREEKAESQVWSAKTQEIRNRLTDKKRMATERWNRFSATEGAGARGL